MGNNQSLSVEEKKSYIQQNLYFIKQVDNDAYGEVKIMKNELSQEILAVKQYSFQKTDRLDAFIKRAEKRKELISPCLVELIDIEADKSEDFCSNFYKLSLVYQYHPETLLQLIDKRKKLRKKFSEHEIFLLIDCICSALLSFESFEMKHEDIRPQTIVISNDNKFKLTDIKFLTQFSQYKRILIGVSDTNYLSPILFQQMEHRYNLYFQMFIGMYLFINQRIANPVHDEIKSDLFSLGLVCLEMASLRSIQGVYDLEKYQISEEKIEGIIFQMKEDSYSETLIELILRMLQIDENDRINPQEIMTFLDPIREQYYNIKLSYTTNKFGDKSYIGDHSQNPLSYISHHQYISPETQSVIINNPSALISRKQSLNQSNFQKEILDTAAQSGDRTLNQSKNNKKYRSSPPKELKNQNNKSNEFDDIYLKNDLDIAKQLNQHNIEDVNSKSHQFHNSNYISEDAQEYWEKSLQYLDHDVENILNETSRLQQKYNNLPKLNLDESAIDCLISKRLEQKNENLMNNMYSHKHSSSQKQPLNSRNNILSSTNIQNSISYHSRQRSNMGNDSKHYLHSDTRSIGSPSMNKLQYSHASTRNNSPKAVQDQNSKATPVKQDFVDKQQGSKNPNESYQNNYKKLVNDQNNKINKNSSNNLQSSENKFKNQYNSQY